jgi:hypothetical protein
VWFDEVEQKQGSLQLTHRLSGGVRKHFFMPLEALNCLQSVISGMK